MEISKNSSWFEPSTSVGAAFIVYLIALPMFNTFDEDVLLISTFAIFLGFLYNSINSSISTYLDLRAQQISMLIEKLQIERSNILAKGSRLNLIQSFLLNRVYNFATQASIETFALQAEHNEHIIFHLNAIYEDFAAFVVREKIAYIQTLLNISLLDYTKRINTLAPLLNKPN